MASIANLKKKVKTLNDFTKVVNIQKIVVMKEIAQWQKVIEKSDGIKRVFIDLVEKLNKSHKALPNDYFFEEGKKPRRIPVPRKLHFIVEGDIRDNISEYELKLVAEYCRLNNKPEDIYVIIGENLGEVMQKEGFKILNVMPTAELSDTLIYSRIAHQLLVSYNDMIHDGATFGFLDTTIKQFNRENIFPLKREVLNMEKIENEEFAAITKLKVSKTQWYKDYDAVAQSLIKTAIESLVYQKIVEYSLTMKRRELQGLDDKEKNIHEEIGKVKLQMSRVRKDAVTNELLTNATAFAALAGEEGGE